MKDIKVYVQEFEIELNNIFTYWSTEAIDPETNQFYGSIDHYGKKDPKSNKGIIMYSRQLWSFSAAAMHYESDTYAQIAGNVYSFLLKHFYDHEHGGYYWETDYAGNVVDNRKQTYAQAFVLYALTEYYKLTKKPEVLAYAKQQFDCIEQKCFDEKAGGYMEGFTREWVFDKANRLSTKDAFSHKSMNTNLHILEAYTSYYKEFKTEESYKALKRIVLDFNHYIIGSDNHLILFMDESWKAESKIHSYGHDIEASWMLWEAVEELKDEVLVDHMKVLVTNMVETFIAEAFDTDNAVYFEKHTSTGKMDTDRHWWPQCEAMEGLASAYGMNGKEEYVQLIINTWEFIKSNMIDTKNGEWFTRVDKNGEPYANEDKGGMWKTPYHNGRAIMKLIKRFLEK